MNKQTVTKTEVENSEEKKKEKVGLEGWLFYLLLFCVIVVLPVSSAIWLLSVA